jgi:hypothetical protein
MNACCAHGERTMTRKLMLALFALPLIAALSGCVIYERGYDGGGYHRHYWHDYR